MKNSDEYLTEAIRNKLTPEEREIINLMQHGSSSMLRVKVNDAAMQMIISKHVNPDSGKKTPWYKKWWAKIIYLFTGLAAILGVIKLILEVISSLR